LIASAELRIVNRSPYAKALAHSEYRRYLRQMRNRSRIVAEPDPNQTALGTTAPEVSSDDTPGPRRKKNRAAAALGRIGGKKGGRVWAERLSPEERHASASKAASIRWAKPPAELIEPAEPDVEPNIQGFPPSPFAKHRGELNLGGNPVDCYVLDTGERVISLRAAVRSIAGVDSSSLADYLAIDGLKAFINSDLLLAETRDFHIPGTQLRGRAILAERFLEICNAYVAALQAGALRTARQRENAVRCSIFLGACAKVGLIALIDEATGYQYERAEDALQIKYRAFIADELREWEKTFPDELWDQFGRLTNWKGKLHQRPKWWGHLVMELIYHALDPDIARYLKNNKPKPYHGQNYHQWLTQDIGLRALIPHIYEVIGIAKTCRDMRELKEKVAEYYGREPVQLTMYLPRMPT
jgi:P63C domain